MAMIFDGKKLAKAVKIQRIIELSIGLREAAKQIGTSAPTLCRVEKGKTPDVETFANICNWICKPMTDFFEVKK